MNVFHAPSAAAAPSKGEVLVVMSGGHILNLADGKPYATGYYLNEVATPLKAIIDAGYTPVFASPNGDTPSMDGSSNVDKFFGGDANKRFEALRLLDAQKGLHHPILLSSVVGHTAKYKAIFVPGGHAPMVDLAMNKDLGVILRDFHANGRSTALICHSPMALISTLPASSGSGPLLQRRSPDLGRPAGAERHPLDPAAGGRPGADHRPAALLRPQVRGRPGRQAERSLTAPSAEEKTGGPDWGRRSSCSYRWGRTGSSRALSTETHLAVGEPW
jgi:putative intracellular protease/amidase